MHVLKCVCFPPVVCPGVRESSQKVSQVRDSYSWVLNIPSKNLHMNFQEVSPSKMHAIFFLKQPFNELSHFFRC